MAKSLIELHYLPSLEYFCSFLQSDEVEIEKYENFVKQTYRNRCYINTANGAQKLIVPVTEKHGKVLMKDVRIDNSTKWKNMHWRAIRSAYGKSVYYGHYADSIRSIIYSNTQLLYDLNFKLLSFCLQSIGLSTLLTESTDYKKVLLDNVIDLRGIISPKISFSQRRIFRPTSYIQVFGNKFVSNLSLIDLLFCEGPNSIHVLRASTKGYLTK